MIDMNHYKHQHKNQFHHMQYSTNILFHHTPYMYQEVVLYRMK